ncbi:hypothetical protein TIFTF001_016026 [Ficus carica]|uniref:Uncharacterized protein n=1 Tax=Ficus carica TaxID=3494 RepID=A0AA88A6S0_FICCA|nr:hypothetical protein TIFTF001_016026 [Ficus carica]
MNRNIITEKGGHNQKPKGRTAKNDVVEKTSPSTTSSSRSRSSSTSCKERPPYHAKIILGFSNETPPNLRTEQRSSSTTRGRGAFAVPPPPRVEEATVKTRQKSCSPSVTRGRKVEPIAAMNNNNNNNNNKQKQQETNRNSKGTVVLGSRMVEKVINARKSNNYNNNNTITSSGTSSNIRLKDTKPADYYSRAAITQKSPNFGLPRRHVHD